MLFAVTFSLDSGLTRDSPLSTCITAQLSLGRRSRFSPLIRAISKLAYFLELDNRELLKGATADGVGF